MNSLITRSSLLSLLSLLAIALSCGSTEIVDDYVEPELTHTLKKIGEYEIPIDSMTATNFLHYEYVKDGEHEYFSILNRITQEINFYDINAKKFAFKIPLAIDGPNGIGNLQGFNSGYHVHNLDSIFVLNRNRKQFFLVDRESQLLNSFDSFRDRSLPSAVIAPFAPMLVHDDRAILLNIQGGMKYDKRNKNYRSDYAMSVGLTNRDNEFFLSYPDVFTTGVWGFDLHRISWTFDLEAERIAVSYPLDNHLYLFDFNGNQVGSAPARSHIVKPAKSISNRQIKSKNGPWEYYLEQGKYGQVFFDPIRRIFIRDCIPGTSIEKQKEGVLISGRRIVILDENLNKTAELKEDSPGSLTLFFNADGIHKYVPTREENTLKFEIYNYVLLNK